MPLASAQVNDAAAALWDAERDRVAIAPLSATYPDLSVAEAYEIQLTDVRRRLSEGRTVSGHKVGLTAKAMQELLGVSEPDYGHILDDMVVASGAELPASNYCQPRVEPEITFLLKAPLKGPNVTVDDVLAATEAVAASIEIIDSRIADWKITLADTIADNASSAATVLSPWVPIVDAPDLPKVGVELLVNKEVVSTGTGEAVLGDPASAVAWLANALAAFDLTIEAGQLVMPGSCTSAPFVNSGDHVEARFGGHLRASAAQTLVLFLAPLVMAAVLLVPGQADWVLGAELVAAGAGGSLSLLAIGQRKRGLSDDDKRLTSIFDRRDTNVVVMLLFVASGAVLASGVSDGLYLLLPASLVAFISGVLNAWNFLLPPDGHSSKGQPADQGRSRGRAP